MVSLPLHCDVVTEHLSRKLQQHCWKHSYSAGDAYGRGNRRTEVVRLYAIETVSPALPSALDQGDPTGVLGWYRFCSVSRGQEVDMIYLEQCFERTKDHQKVTKLFLTLTSSYGGFLSSALGCYLLPCLPCVPA